MHGHKIVEKILVSNIFQSKSKNIYYLIMKHFDSFDSLIINTLNILTPNFRLIEPKVSLFKLEFKFWICNF